MMYIVMYSEKNAAEIGTSFLKHSELHCHEHNRIAESVSRRNSIQAFFFKIM
jgi:hypothetical protein